MTNEEYYNDYPKEPIGGDNPYYCCSYCGISVPQINGQLKNHAEWCEYRIKKNGETEMTQIEDIKKEFYARYGNHGAYDLIEKTYSLGYEDAKSRYVTVYPVEVLDLFKEN